MAVPTVEAEFFESLSNRDEMIQGSGSVVMGQYFDKSTFPDAVYNDDGSLNTEVLLSLLSVAMNLNMEVENLENLTSAEWTSEAGLSGISFTLDMTETRGLQMQMFVYDDGEQLVGLAGMATPDQWEQMQPLFEAISMTLRPVETEE